MKSSSDATRAVRQKMRGYVLIEVMIGGVLSATIIAGLLAMQGAGSDDGIRAGRRVLAAQAAAQEIERAYAVGFANLAAGTTGPTPVPILSGNYQRTVTITSGTDTVGGLSLAFREITVLVTYGKSGTGAVQSVTTSARVYDRP